MRIVAFAVPKEYNGDTLQNGRQCCPPGDVTCLPPKKDGYRAYVANRGARDGYFFHNHMLFKKKVL